MYDRDDRHRRRAAWKPTAGREDGNSKKGGLQRLREHSQINGRRKGTSEMLQQKVGVNSFPGPAQLPLGAYLKI